MTSGSCLHHPKPRPHRLPVRGAGPPSGVGGHSGAGGGDRPPAAPAACGGLRGGDVYGQRRHRHFAAPVAADGGAGGEHPHPGPAGAAGTGVPGGGLGPAHPHRTHPGKE